MFYSLNLNYFGHWPTFDVSSAEKSFEFLSSPFRSLSYLNNFALFYFIFFFLIFDDNKDCGLLETHCSLNIVR
jgi:hypothetical protein